jgi:autotransporter translocation and assembly factor TamB
VQFPSFLPASTGNARLQFRGTAPDDLELSGSIEIAEMVLRDPINWQRSLLTLRARSTENLAPQDKPGLFRLNLAVSSGGGSVRIDNNLGDMHGTSRSFRVSGDTNRVLLGGVVQVDGGRFPYSGHDFVLEPGTARFREGSGWFPELDLRMWTDISNRDETYRITYAVTGPLDDPKLVPSSEPYLAEADINLLLLLGMTQEQLAQANLPEVLAAAGGAGAGAYGESVGTSVGQTATIGKQLLPDQFEIVPVYSDTTGATTVWAVGTKELIPDLLTGEAGVGVGGRGQAPDSVFRVQLRLARNVYLEGSWVRDDKASADYGNFGLDVQFQVDLD